MKNQNEVHYPYILFKIADSLYCINSKYIQTIAQLPEFSTIPASPDNVRGMFKYREQVVQILDLRITFGLKALSDEYNEFAQMIDIRKQDHINWVKELERYIKEGGTFHLAKDHHECALGKWYDNFTTNNNAVTFHLRKIEDPHEKLHKAYAEAENCKRDCKNCEQDECLLQILNKVKDNTMPIILNLLEQTKEIFRNTIYNEMVLILDGMNWGLIVDEIVAVEDLKLIDSRENEAMVNQCSYINNVMESERHEGLIFELNTNALSYQLKELQKTF